MNTYFRPDEYTDDNSWFMDILREHDIMLCTNCESPLELSGVRQLNSGSTEAGTDYCVVGIECNQCDYLVVEVESWYPGASDVDEMLHVLDKDNWTINTPKAPPAE